ncbi:hypothetical protein B5F90_05130 [Alistipes sp. An31A]|uniref:hypothetical protein n=1 Tax=Alistipes sp. An31A TaxID=1965631 RepID=UPI000B3ACFD6|nr:hypothetical protein [Alistipes sp. An31A]OUO21477.1 hypothetical protein B5F90_05130 [Alistipes sp. An31A]
MEDYAPILWLLFIVVSMGFSALSKARKRAARRADETEEGQERNAGQGHPTVPRYPTPGSGLPEGFPLPQQRSRRPATSPSTGGAKSTTQQTAAQRATAQQAAASRSQTAATASSQHGLQHAGESLQRRHSNISAAQPQVMAAMREKEPVRLPETEETANEIVAEFDLRKAVIYAEILKPKFEE